MKINNNTVVEGSTVRCAHCSAELGTYPDNPFAKVAHAVQPSTAAGPGVRVPPTEFTDREVVLRQSFCPECLTLLSTEIVPADEPDYRTWTAAL